MALSGQPFSIICPPFWVRLIMLSHRVGPCSPDMKMTTVTLPTTDWKRSTNVQNLFHMYKWTHKGLNVYRVSVYVCIFANHSVFLWKWMDRNLHNTSKKNTCYMMVKIFVDHSTHLWIVLYGLQQSDKTVQ